MPVEDALSTVNNAGTDKKEVQREDSQTSRKEAGMERSPLMRQFRDGSSVPLVTTILLMGAYIAYGMTVGIIGPTILDLALLLDKTLSEVSFLVMTRPLGTSLGAILSPLFCSRMNPFLFLFAVNFLSGAALVATPFSSNVYLTCLFLGLAGLGTGLLSTGSNIYLLDIWADGALPWLQATYGLLGVGALVAPLIAAPFLLESTNEQAVEVLAMTNASSGLTASAFTAGSEEVHGETQVHVVYIVIGGFTLASAMTFFIQWMCVGSYRFTGRTSHQDSQQARALDGEGGFSHSKEENRKLHKIAIVTCACFFFFVLVYSEIGYADLVMAFAVYSDLQMTKARAAAINSFYWGSYTAARLASAIVSIKIRPMKILIASFVIGTVGTMLLLLFANDAELWLWVGSGLLALGRAAIYASGIALLERFIYITPLIFGLFVVFSAGGEAIVSWVVARNLEKQPMDMMYAETAANFIMILAFGMLYYLLVAYRRKYLRKAAGADVETHGGAEVAEGSRVSSPAPLQSPASRTSSNEFGQNA